MKLKNKTKSILSAFLAVCMLLSISPVTTFAAQSNEYVDPADNWLSSNNRTNELDVNATTTYETQFCCVCNMQTTVLTYRVPEYTRSGETALNRDVRYSDGTCLDEERKGNLDSGTPGIDAYYTGYHWTKAVCQNCGTINSGDGMETYSFNNNVYSLNPCDNNFFLQFDNTTHEKYDDEYHLTTLKRGEYCKFCKGTYARATRGLADHNFTEQVDGQVANNRFYIAETCDDCGYETSEYVTAKAVVSSYYGVEDGEAHTLTVSDLSDSGVKTSIRYGTDADNCNKTSAPNYTQPGYYTVYYKINYSYSGESMIENGVSYVHILADESDEGGSNTIIVVPPAHEHDFRYLETIPASCENLGYERWQCDGCGELQKMNYSPAKGHNYEDITIREATCKQGGLKLTLCKDCGDFHQETTPTGNHNYHTTTHNATCRSVGYTDHTCEVCGDNFVTDIKPLISHAYEHITKEPTCEDKGYTTSTCVMCGSSYVSDYTEPTGHNWDEGTSVTSSTCEADGVIEYVCQNEDCGEKMIKADAATGHTPGEAATCTEPQICTVCETVLALPTGHNHSESVIAPTCEAMGYSVFTCDCGDTYTANFTDKAEHEYETEITEPTCVSMGHTHYDCVNCDYEFDADYTDKLPHDYKADVTAPSCSAFGFTVYTCECGDTYTSDYTDKTEHNYNKQIVEPTCEEHGYAVYECPDCGASYIGDYTENKEHIYKETVIAPSCTEMGYTIFTCDCGDTYKGNYTDKIPHDYEKKVTPATCEEMGYTVYDCKNCDDTYTSDYTDIIPHNYKSEITAATCVSLGFTTFVCEDCGHTYKAEYVEPKGHTPSDWIIDVPATITSGGSKHVECSVCGETLQTAEIAQLIDADRTDEDGAAEVGDFSIILTDKNGTPIFNSEIVIDVDNKISIKLPNGRLLDYADQTTITAFFTENQKPAADLNIFIEDKNGNNATGTTDTNGQLKVPNNQSSTGDDNGTIGNENNEVKNTYVVSVTDKYNVIIPNCDIKIGESNNVVVDLPDGLILTKDSPAIITITNQNGEPQKDVSVIVIADKDYIEKGLTDRYGKLTVPPVNSGYTDKEGKVNVNGFNVIVNDEAKQIENAFVTLNDDNTISVLLPAENLIDYSNRICVTVLDKDGAAVKDMTVKVIDVTENNRSGVTDENGKMVVPPLSEDKTDKDGKATVNGLNILVTDEKAVIENAFVTIADGKINIELPTDKVIDIANRIIVTVTDSENKAVKDMSVTVKDNTERTETNLTDADGKAVIPPTTFDITDVNGYGELTGFEIVVTDESKVIENASLTLNEDNSISVVLPAETLIVHSNRITVTVTNKADKTPAKDVSVTVSEAPKAEADESTESDNTADTETAAPKSVSGKTDADGKIVVPPLSEDITDNEGNSGVTDKEEKPGEDTDGDGKEDKPGETVTTLYKVALNDTKGVITDAFVKIEDGKVYITLPETHTLTTSNQVTATITDNDGKAVKGVSVTIADKTTSKTGTTDANGKVTLPVKSSGGGGGTSRPSSSGGGGGGGSYVSTTVKIVDKDGKTVSVSKSVSTTKATLTLPTGKKLTDDNYYTITVTSSGKAKADYTVVLKDRSGNEITGTTDANGVVMLPGKKHSAYIFGYPDSTFRPDGDMTRSEAAAIFARLIAEEKGEKISGTSTDFKDISKKAWYASYVSYLEKYGIIKGYTDNTFRPDNKVTRAEFIAMTVRYYDLFNDVKYTSTSVKYTDVSSSYWAVKEIAYAKNIGWLNGYADGTFRGDNNITRAEVVTVVNRATGRNADKEYVNENFTKLNRFTDVTDSSKWYFYDVNEAANEHIGITHSDGETWSK